MAEATGIGAFRTGLRYDHGGLSLQECLVPSFTIHGGVQRQLAKIDSIASRSGAGLGLAVLLGLCGALLQKSIKGGLVVAGALNLGGSIDPINGAVEIAELAIDKGATALWMPVSARKQRFNLPDDLATKIDMQF